MDPRRERDDPAPVYDVLLDGSPPGHLTADFPEMAIATTATHTAVRCPARGSAQLDSLLDTVFAWGLSLLSLHLVRGTARDEQVYEVRLAGDVGERLAWHRGWTHRLVPCQTRLRVAVETDDLQRFLLDCTESGASIAEVSRVGRVRGTEVTGPRPPRQSRVSTGRAGDHGVRRPSGG